MAALRDPHQHRRLDHTGQQGLVRRIVGLFGPYKLPVAVVGLVIVLNAGLGVLNPVLIREVFDSALFPADGQPNLTLLWVLAALMAAIAVAGGALSIVQTYLTSRIGQDVTGDLQEAVYDHLLGMSLSFLARTRTGEMQSRVSHDINGIEPVVTRTIADLVASVVALIAVVVAMLFLSWQFTVVAMAMLPVFFLLTRWVGRKRREVAASAQGSMAQVTAVTEETLSLSGILLAKLFGRQHDELHHFRRHNDELSRFVVRQQMIAQSFYAAATAFLTLLPALVYLAAGYLIFMGGAGAATAGTIIAFTALQARLYQPVERLLQVSLEMQTSLALFERIFGYLDLEQEITDAPAAVSLERDKVEGEVVFDSVRVRGQGSEGEANDPHGANGKSRQWTLDGVTLPHRAWTAGGVRRPERRGEDFTIAALVPRLFDATEGHGVDRRYRRAPVSSWPIWPPAWGSSRRRVSCSRPASGRTCGTPGPMRAEDEVVAAAKAAYIHDRIMELPDGYANRGGRTRASGCPSGETATAVYREDAAARATHTHPGRGYVGPGYASSERRLQSALKPLVEGRTTLVIAHRLSTILAADVIFT